MKKLLLITLTFVTMLSAAGCASTTPINVNTSSDNIQATAKSTPETASTNTKNIPTEYKSALKSAKSYSDTLHMSKQAIYDQLISEYGGKFTAEAAQYAIDNLDIDYNENALKSAESYQETLHMSPAAIHDQLTSVYGGKFTAEEADYAIEHLE